VPKVPGVLRVLRVLTVIILGTPNPPAVYFFTIDVTAYTKKSPLLLKEGWPADVRRMAGVVD